MIEIFKCPLHSHGFSKNHPCPECAGTLKAPEEMPKREFLRLNFCAFCEKEITTPKMFCDDCKYTLSPQKRNKALAKREARG